jgi:hypothetical protein
MEEVIGITQKVSRLIEAHRQRETETQNDILERVLSNGLPAKTQPPAPTGPGLDLGQGVVLREGEPLFLFLDKASADRQEAAARAEVRGGSFFMEGEKIAPSKGSVLHPAMERIQQRHNHVNAKGELISLSAWRQWHVIRNDRYTRLADLKDPALAKRRGGKSKLTLEDLDL